MTNGTDSSGTLLISKPPGNYALVAAGQTRLTEDSVAQFLKWGDLPDPMSLNASRFVNLKSNQTVRLLVTLSYQVSISFTDSKGSEVDKNMVQSALVQSSDGQSYALTTYDNLWFVGNRFQRTPTDWRVIDTTYTVNLVNVTGRNVVQRGLNTYSPAPGATWTVPLLLYSLKVTVADLLFGFPLDANVRITDLYSGTEVKTIRAHGGQAFLSTFPRGSYVLHISGVGIALPVPIIFTGPSSHTVRVFSIVDAVFVLSFLGAAPVLVHRRSKILSRLRGRPNSDLPAKNC